ncbi:c-type cytochrome [Arcticibacterium luteifluviistationis]|uniref:Cytochrome C n=1 Tax=Arcticibacterium luteifluviistationis TaxID=1784714 RepID=A0A2Z4G877_9BACT|nr:cytochrome c [Arcticibacterium luteifluviistationis]AWV97278.1 cytochrome C [Arcticibacterium luteifluviistationis]
MACTDSEKMEYDIYLVNGENLYKQNCANCHGEKGEGLRNLYPPLRNNEHLKSTEHVICIIKNGASGKLELNGQVYDQAMPANPKLFNLDIAQLVTYLNKEFNETDEKVEVSEVIETLNNCK